MPPDYNPLEKMLYRGFLTSEVEVGGVPIVLKTLNQNEVDLCDLHAFSLSGTWEDAAAYSLAYSTLFLNHVNVLPSRHDWIPTLAAAYRDMPSSVLISLLVVANNLNEKASASLRNVQGYAYGPASRQMWYMLKGTNLCDPMITGVTGTDTIGLNMHQRLWAYFNHSEDEDTQYLQMYSLTKFIVSPHAPKDVKRIDGEDKKRMRTREGRRKALYEGADPNLVTEDNQIRISDETAEELLEQMERTVRGEKDFHDMVIEEHRKKVRDAYIKQREEAQRRSEIAKKKRREQFMREHEESINLEGYTDEEIEHYLRVSDQKRREQRIDASSSPPIEQQERNLLRWGFIEGEDAVPLEDGDPLRTEEPDFENPLIKEHYERVREDINPFHKTDE